MPYTDLVEHFFGEGAVRLADRLRQELGETAEIISDDLVRNWLIAESGSLTASILSEIVERKGCYSARPLQCRLLIVTDPMSSSAFNELQKPRRAPAR